MKFAKYTCQKLFLFLSAALVTAALPVPAQEENAPPPGPEVLQLRIDVPVSWEPFMSDDVADAIEGHVRETFRRQGFKGTWERVDMAEKASTETPLLEVRLLQWRISRTGLVECTMAASLRSADGEEISLGSFTATEFSWGPEGRWETAEHFRNSAEDAARQIYRRLERGGYLPSMIPERSRS